MINENERGRNQFVKNWRKAFSENDINEYLKVLDEMTGESISLRDEYREFSEEFKVGYLDMAKKFSFYLKTYDYDTILETLKSCQAE